jgi:hypothetical protein
MVSRGSCIDGSLTFFLDILLSLVLIYFFNLERFTSLLVFSTFNFYMHELERLSRAILIGISSILGKLFLGSATLIGNNSTSTEF